MDEPASHRRTTMAIAWVVLMVAWVLAAFFVLTVTGLGPCGGDGGSPYAAPASPAGRYCDGVDAYFDSGEPGELTTALVYFWPVITLAAVGVYGVWKRQKRPLLVAASVVFVVLAVHLGLALGLRDRCSPDDPSLPGCAHY